MGALAYDQTPLTTDLRRNVDFRQLKYFIAVAEECSIGRASARLHISQPPLTRQIQQLEEALGAQLLIRSPRGVELTQAGEIFLEEARNILALMDRATARVKRASQGKLGHLDIGIFGTGVFSVIPKLLNLFREEHPDVNVVLHSMSKDEQITALRENRIMLAFNRLIPALPDLERQLIVTEPLYLAVHSSHALSQSTSVSFFELAKHPIVLFPNAPHPNFVDRVLELCRSKGFDPHIAQMVGDSVTGIALVAGGFGLSVVPESLIALKPPGIEYRPFNDAPEACVDLTCIYRKENHSPVLKEFLQIIQSFQSSLGAAATEQ
jgi:LysR family transcriptional regulator, benzoate and cis,cis-muconate-responsive activator of ben and cat genes